MKIIILVCSRDLAHGGGMDRVIHHSLKELNKRFDKVVVVSASSVENLIVGIIKILKENPFSFDCFIFNSLGSFRLLYNKYWTYYYYLASLFKIKKVIYWHEMPEYYKRFEEDISTAKEVKLIENKFKNKKLLHLCCSIENSKICYFFDSDPRYKIINNCITKNLPSELLFDKFTVTSVGSIQYRKGVDLWVKTAIKVCKQIDDIRFVWCGGILDKELYQDCIDMINKNRLQNQILFFGHIEDAKFVTSFSHLFYLSSREDTFALSVLEAMSFGKNIIHYDSGGVCEAVGDYGILVENFDVDITVDKIIEVYYESKENPSSIFNENLLNRFINNYSPEIFSQKLKNALYEL